MKFLCFSFISGNKKLKEIKSKFPNCPSVEENQFKNGIQYIRLIEILFLLFKKLFDY